MIRVQERGTRRETHETVEFETYDEALRAAQKLEDDWKAGAENDILVVASGSERVSLIRQDFRRTRIYETGMLVGDD